MKQHVELSQSVLCAIHHVYLKFVVLVCKMPGLVEYGNGLLLRHCLRAVYDVSRASWQQRKPLQQ